MRLRLWRVLGFAALASLPAPLAAAEDPEPVAIHDGSRVSIEFTLKLDDGTVVESTERRGGPVVYRQGANEIPPALEQALAGLHVGQEKEVTLAPEDAYGPVDPAAFHTVPLDALPEGARQTGAQLVTTDGAGNQRPVRVHEVDGDEAVLDFNHPLAGKTIHFEIRVTAVE